MSLLTGFLKCDAKVTQTYAAATIEKLVMKKENGKVILNNENIDQNVLMALLGNLCNLLSEQ